MLPRTELSPIRTPALLFLECGPRDTWVLYHFEELATDAEACCKVNLGQQFDLYRIGGFGNRPAAIPIDYVRNWFGKQEWENATHNRSKLRCR